MRTIRWWSGVVVVALTLSTPAWARVVKIEMAAPLPDRSDRSVDRAIKSAVDTCVSRATAMGLSWIWLHDAAVLPGKVVVQMIATDEDEEDETQDVQALDLTSRDRAL
ncbi:MAG TPA: hypothetical protein VGT40_22980 [Methylomirabilota bacterium]|jgi:hypothetical protein|nr:hypothetical protein [Methylomirabilota bacterium]